MRPYPPITTKPLWRSICYVYNSKALAHKNAHLTQYLLQRLLGDSTPNSPRIQRPPSTATVEDRIFAAEGDPSVVYPQYQRDDIRRYLDEAKEQIDVIDFRTPRRSLEKSDYVRRPRNNLSGDLQFSDGPADETTSESRTTQTRGTPGTRGSSGSASEQVPIKLAFPGNEFTRKSSSSGCTNCIPEATGLPNRWTMPLTTLGSKQYYLGVFFKANWYKAQQYCRFHGMHLASINSAEEQRDLQEHVQAYGMGHEHFWTSGTDQGEEGKFFWLSTGKPVTYSNWNAGEPNNFEYEDGEQEHCLEMWDRDGKGLGWNDTPCSFQTFFVCEV
ncbi:mannose-binding protein C-like isoform X3 [Tigriopus californicus]|uniref:mannose-binding protein C-like isoform X3 n=1 Tax=Tigriopus californicus TaxID=6832 RepID=UPI0027D9E066|nr:mannose-binding protein C-like isoform X3 [Tigriopus californicus]